MKLTLLQWGELFDVISHENEPKDLSKKLRNFILLLRKYRMLGKLPMILRVWEKIKNKREDIVDAHYEGVFPFSQNIQQELEAIIYKKTHAKHIVWKEKENHALLGGAKIFFDGYLLDMSVLSKLRFLSDAFKKI